MQKALCIHHDLDKVTNIGYCFLFSWLQQNNLTTSTKSYNRHSNLPRERGMLINAHLLITFTLFIIYKIIQLNICQNLIFHNERKIKKKNIEINRLYKFYKIYHTQPVFNTSRGQRFINNLFQLLSLNLWYHFELVWNWHFQKFKKNCCIFYFVWQIRKKKPYIF